VNKNEREGMQWIMQSAKLGYPQAAEALAKAYAEGLYGLEQDAEQAHYWYQRAGKKFQ
jgi:TPR repeat protein